MTADRQVRIMASDYSTQVLLAEALQELERDAPQMRFEIQPMNDFPIEALERGYIDLLLTIDYAISADHPSLILFEDDYVVVGWEGNPAMAGPMTRETYFELGHVTARFGKSRVPAFEDWFVRRQKQQRRVEVVAPTFLSLPGLLVNTKRVTTMHRRLAEQVVQSLPLVMREAPFHFPPIREALQWHLSNNNDSTLRWIVERLRMIAARKIELSAQVLSMDGRRIDRDALEVEYRLNHPQAPR
jgi:LysR family nod box-dependent transcriptional activator